MRFNIATYVNRILGNAIYGFNFGSPYCGVIVKGLRTTSRQQASWVARTMTS